MIKRILSSLIAILAFSTSAVFFFGFIKIARDYGWSFTTEINFGIVNGTAVLGAIWIPLVVCLVLGLGFLILGSKQLAKVFFKKSAIEPTAKVNE